MNDTPKGVVPGVILAFVLAGLFGAIMEYGIPMDSDGNELGAIGKIRQIIIIIMSIGVFYGGIVLGSKIFGDGR